MDIIGDIKAAVASGEIKPEVPVRQNAVGTVTAYGVWKIVDATFRAVGIVRPNPYTAQNVYGHAKGGALDGIVTKSAKGRRFTAEQIDKYIRKLVALNLQYLVDQSILDRATEGALETIEDAEPVAEFDEVDDETEGGAQLSDEELEALTRPDAEFNESVAKADKAFNESVMDREMPKYDE